MQIIDAAFSPLIAPATEAIARVFYQETATPPAPVACIAEMGDAACLASANIAQIKTHDVGSGPVKLDAALTAAAMLPTAAGGTGMFSDGKLTLLFRNFLAAEHVDEWGGRSAWVQAMQAQYVSGYTAGLVGVGLSVTPFATLSIHQSNNAGNYVYSRRRAEDGPTLFLGGYTANVRLGDTVFKYGLQQLSNPILESQYIYSLPPTFQGITMESPVSAQLSLVGGRLSSVKPRGDTSLQSLVTTYGRVNFKSMDFLGADWTYSNNGKASIYLDRASDVWKQLYVSLTQSVGNAKELRLTGKVDAYYTRNQGSSLQGAIDNKAYSVSLTGERGANAVLLGYQQIRSDQYFDYPGETWGDALLNAMDVDYNAPNEKSVQLNYVFDGSKASLPGFSLMLWFSQGWGADASAGAALFANPDSLLHSLYWKNGKPVHGSHHEFGIWPSYVFQSGPIKSAKVTAQFTLHRSTAHYADSGNRQLKIRMDIPFKIF